MMHRPPCPLVPLSPCPHQDRSGAYLERRGGDARATVPTADARGLHSVAAPRLCCECMGETSMPRLLISSPTSDPANPKSDTPAPPDNAGTDGNTQTSRTPDTRC